MSRELIITHAGATIFGRTTSDAFADAVYQITDEDEGELGKELLMDIRDALNSRRKAKQREIDGYEMMMKCPTISYEDWMANYNAQLDAMDELDNIKDGMAWVDTFSLMLSEMKYSEGNVDITLRYFKSY